MQHFLFEIEIWSKYSMLCVLLKTNLQDDAFEERDQIDPDDNENFESRTIVEKIEDQLKQKNRKSQQAKDSDAIANKELCEVSHINTLGECKTFGSSILNWHCTLMS